MDLAFLLLVALFQFSSAFSSPVENEVPSLEPEELDRLLENGEYEEFARLLRIDDVNLVIPKEGNHSVHRMYNEGMPLGDILLTKEQTENSRQGINFQIYGGRKWPNGQVPYVISSSDFSMPQRWIIQNAIKDFNSKNTGVTFTPRINEEDYVMMFSGQGCYSFLGKIGKQQAISLLRDECVVPGIVQHQMMHAIGYTHEQNRPDRDEYVEILYNNIPPAYHSQYEKSNSRDFVTLGDYDYYSVMHAAVPAPETGRRAFIVLKSGINEGLIGQRVRMTELDISKIRALYL